MVVTLTPIVLMVVGIPGSMVVSGSPKRWYIGGIVHPPIGRKNTTYIPLIVLAFRGVKNATYHLLGEPETTIEITYWKQYSKCMVVFEGFPFLSA